MSKSKHGQWPATPELEREPSTYVEQGSPLLGVQLEDFKKDRREACSGFSFSQRHWQLVAIALLTCGHIVTVGMIWTGHLRLVGWKHEQFPPDLGLKTPVTFLEDKAFLPSAPDRGTFAWHELTYSYLDAGAIYLKHPETLGILPGEQDSDIAGYDLYVMAFAHQHHCLGTIREGFYGLNLTEAQIFGPGQLSDHYSHCFDYLRQSITCSADMTLENTRIGMKVTHSCKSPDEVARFRDVYGKRNALGRTS